MHTGVTFDFGTTRGGGIQGFGVAGKCRSLARNCRISAETQIKHRVLTHTNLPLCLNTMNFKQFFSQAPSGLRHNCCTPLCLIAPNGSPPRDVPDNTLCAWTRSNKRWFYAYRIVVRSGANRCAGGHRRPCLSRLSHQGEAGRSRPICR